MHTKLSHIALALAIGLLGAAGVLAMMETGNSLPATLYAQAPAAPTVAPPSTGGPDAFGYIYTDSLVSGGLYSWVDIAASGTALSFGDPDEGKVSVSLPQTMTFYGEDYTTLYIAANGYATFQDTDVVTQCAPADRQPPDTLAAFCTDLNVGHTVYTAATTYNGHQALTIQYDSVTHTASSITATFQIILDLEDDSVTYQYLSVPTTSPSTTTIGIAGHATNRDDFLVYCRGTTDCPPQAGMAVRFAPAAHPVLNLQIIPSDDFPQEGDTVTYAIVLSNTGDATAGGAVMVNELPTGLDYVTGTLQATGGTPTYLAASRTVRWEGDLAVNSPVTVTYAAALNTSDYIYNTAVISHPQAFAEAGATSSPVDAWGGPELVDHPHYFDPDTLGISHYIAVDSGGVPHIAYGGNGLYYATLDGNTWISETVIVTPTSRATLIIDNQDHALISFSTQEGLWLARQVSTTGGLTWTTERIITLPNYGIQADLQQGADDRLHLVYYASGDLYYTVYSDTVWLAPTMAITSEACALYRGYSLAVDQNNVPHVACVHRFPTPREVRVYDYAASAPWTAYTVATSTYAGDYYYPGLAYDGNTPHLSFFEGDHVLYHAQQDGGWDLTQVEDLGWIDYRDSAALDIRGGQVAIAYAMHRPRIGSRFTATIRLASRPLAGTDWTTETVEFFASNWARPEPVVALDGTGHAHLAYYYSPDETLRHAAQTGSFTLRTVDRSRRIWSAAIAVGSDETVHMAYLSKGLRYATSPPETSTWTPELAIPGVDATSLSMDLDAADVPHIAYASYADPLYHATLNGSTWVTRQVDVPGNLFPGTVIKAEAANTAHLAYLAEEGSDFVVRHAAFDGSTWVTETLATAGTYKSHTPLPSMVVQNGKTYILYADCTAYQSGVDYPIDLMLATLDGGWSTEPLYHFSGRCDWNLDFQLRGDGNAQMAAVVWIRSDGVRPSPMLLTLAIEGSGAASGGGLEAVPTGHTIRTLSLAPAATTSSGVPPTGYRGTGLETVQYTGNGKEVTYEVTTGGGGGYQSQPTVVYSPGGTDSYICPENGLDRSGSTAAVAETAVTESDFYRPERLTSQRTPRREPPEAQAKKSASPAAPAGIYPEDEQIDYNILLSWSGEEEASIAVGDPYSWPAVDFVPGTLSWGAYIVICTHNDSTHSIGCSGMFPAPGGTTHVSFSAEGTCQMYDDKSQVINNGAAVVIDGFGFAPTAQTMEKTPFRLKSSTPTFLPQANFSPGHTVLLYTVPKGDEPDCCTKCPLDVYVVVNKDIANPIKMSNGGAGLNNRADADFIGGDCHHSLWYEPTDNRSYTFDLYVASAGKKFEDAAALADTLVLQPITAPKLAVLTDHRELFREFDRVTPTSPSRDTDPAPNCIKDFYDALARVHQYAAAHDGVVLDVRQDAYTSDWNYASTTQTRKRMGESINERLVPALERYRVTLWNLAIIGDDAVVPFYRVAVPAGTFNETNYPNQMDGVVGLNTGVDGNSTLADTASTVEGANQGYIMSDVPYGTFKAALDDYPRPIMSVGRIFYDRPLDLIQAIAAYEQPLDLRAAQSSAAGLHLANEAVGGKIQFVRVFNRTVRPLLYSHYGPQPCATPDNPGPGGVCRDTLFNQPANYFDHWAYIYSGVITPWNANNSARRAFQNTDLVLLYSHADQFRWVTQATVQGVAGERDINRTDLTGANADLVLSIGCHSGYSTAYAQTAAAHPYYRQNLVRAFLDRHVAYFAPTAYGVAPTDANAASYTPLMTQNFLEGAFSRYRDTVGLAYRTAFFEYRPTGALAWQKDFDRFVLYGIGFYGLPTQPLRNQATHAVVQLAPGGGPAAAWPGVSSPAALLTATEQITIPHFAVSFDEQDRAIFEIPGQGGLWAESFGPLLPAVHRTYPLPLEATDLVVTLVGTQTHAYPTPVALQTMVPAVLSFGPLSGTFTYTHPYPASVLQTWVVTDPQSLILNLTALPLQIDPDTGQVTLYDHLAYRVSYQAPATATVQSLAVNQGAPVTVGDSAVPISLTLQSTTPFTGMLVYAVEDGTATTVWDGSADLDLSAGTAVLEWDVDATNWQPGAYHLWAAVHDATGKVIASGWADFTATGHWLTAETDKSAYTEADSVAEVRVTVRDETGTGVSGQAGDLSLDLDSSAAAATWQEGDDGIYTTTLGLGGLAVGEHSFSAWLGTLSDGSGFQVDRSAPTSTAWLTSTGNVTSTWVHVSWEDDATGPSVITVEVQTDGGAWEFWRTFRPGYVEGTEAVYTEPEVNLLEHTYCFRSQAIDQVGHQEAKHTTPDACTSHSWRIYLPLVFRN